MNTVLSFTLARKVQPVTIDGNHYTLMELTGKERDDYLTKSASRVQLSSDGKPAKILSVDSISIVELSLRDSENKPVPRATLQSWPASVIEALSKLAQELNGMNQGEKSAQSEAKKDSDSESGSTGSS